MDIRCKRAYEAPAAGDGQRILVDRIWPRGVSKNRLELDGGRKDLAPSRDLREWFGHDADRWDEFRERYFAELDARRDAVDELLAKTNVDRLTLVYGAKDEEHNNAVALQEYLSEEIRD